MQKRVRSAKNNSKNNTLHVSMSKKKTTRANNRTTHKSKKLIDGNTEIHISTPFGGLDINFGGGIRR